MSPRKRAHQKNKNFDNTLPPFRYAQALEAVGRERVRLFMPLDELLPGLSIDHGTQEKLMAVIAIMDGIGKLPGDVPKDQFDQPVNYRKLPTEAIDWLEKIGFRARSHTPLATYSYRHLFATKEKGVVPQDVIEKFFSHLIHCLLVETQLIITRQYYHGMGFYRIKMPLIDLSVLPKDIQDQFSKPQLNQIAVDQLHGRIYLDYFILMTRAQWDKVISLTCLVFGLKQSWDSIFDGIRALRNVSQTQTDINPLCIYYLNIFLEIANERLKTDGWLRPYRDGLLHGVGQHSAGVAPHKKSLLTTTELWDKACEEHNWLREAVLALVIALVNKGFGSTSQNQTSPGDKEKF